MYRIVTFCIATLIAGSMFVASPIHAGDTKDPAEVKLPTILFDGKKINGMLAKKLAKGGNLLGWANCSTTDRMKREYDLAESGACIALFVGQPEEYSIFVVRDDRCARRSRTTCYGNYRLFGRIDSKRTMTADRLEILTKSYVVRKKRTRWRKTYTGKMTRWYEQKSNTSYEAGWAAYDADGKYIDGQSMTATASSSDCGASTARDEDDCADYAQCEQDKCEQRANKASSTLAPTGGAVGCIVGGILTSETGPGAAGGCMLGGAIGTAIGAALSPSGVDCADVKIDSKEECEARLDGDDGPTDDTGDEPEVETY